MFVSFELTSFRKYPGSFRFYVEMLLSTNLLFAFISTSMTLLCTVLYTYIQYVFKIHGVLTRAEKPLSRELQP
jgi:hypothetical protein